MMTLLFIAFSYLLGSVPSGLLLCRAIWHIDIREHGSRNIGATNVYRTLGKVPGALVFLLDFFKGFLSVGIAMEFIGTPLAMIICGVAAILGHSASVFLRFQGGKGVATGLGVIGILMPELTVIVFFIWLGIVFLTRYVSLGSIVSAVFVPVLAFFFDYPREYQIFSIFAALLIIMRHYSNIGRLLQGRESKIKAGKR